MAGNEVILQDPYSDVSVFLSRKIQEQARSIDPSKGGSLYLQERLLRKITPEFIKRFPDYRLTITAIKKTWDKVFHTSQLFKQHSSALKADGKINIYYLIRQNLKHALSNPTTRPLPPFFQAQQIALKVGEALASFEGTRPNLDKLTELVCSAQQHLVAPIHFSFSNKKREPLAPQDRLIAKWMVDCLMLNPTLSQQELYQQLHAKLKLFQEMPNTPLCLIHKACMDWASLLIAESNFFQHSSSQDIRQLRTWISHRLYLSDLDEQILELKSQALSCRLNISLNDVELFSWNLLKEIHPIEASPLLYKELIQEAKINLIHHPEQPWKSAILQAARFCMQAHQISKLGSKTDWSDRIELWSLQGELALGSLHFSETPLLHFVRQMLQANISLADPATCGKLRELYLSKYSHPLVEPSLVHQMADLMRRYGWYALASTEHDISLERWIALHSSSSSLQFPLLPLELFLARRSNHNPTKIKGIESH